LPILGLLLHRSAGTDVRVTSISPGMAGKREFSLVRDKSDEGKAAGVCEDVDPLKADAMVRKSP
jgi:NADP-dependent 3-hydroxy acid dehydrogenase YdfG